MEYGPAFEAQRSDARASDWLGLATAAFRSKARTGTSLRGHGLCSHDYPEYGIWQKEYDNQIT